MVELGAAAPSPAPAPAREPAPSPFKPAFPGPAFPPAPEAMAEQPFQALLAVLDREALADDRLRVLETAGRLPALLGRAGARAADALPVLAPQAARRPRAPGAG
jgi:hypothetical protein